MIRGEIETATTSWAFEDPCLTPGDSALVADWLGRVSLDLVEPQDFVSGRVRPTLFFTEPEIAFSLASRSDREVRIRVHISALALPREVRPLRRVFQLWVEVTMSLDGLNNAANVWRQETSKFPPRKYLD